MSSILEALERADKERQAERTQPTGFRNVVGKSPWNRPLWIIGSLILLANLFALGWLFGQKEQPDPEPGMAHSQAQPTNTENRSTEAPQQTAVASTSKPVPQAILLRPSDPPLLEQARVAEEPEELEEPSAAPVKSTTPPVAKTPPAQTDTVAAQQPAAQMITPVVRPIVKPPAADSMSMVEAKAKTAQTATAQAEKPAVAADRPTAQAPTSTAMAEPEPQAQASEETATEAAQVVDSPIEPQISAEPPVEERKPPIPVLWELPYDQQQRFDNIKISIRVYHADPARRFVIINAQRYMEGDELPEKGLRLEEITRDGIIVDYGQGKVRL